MLMEVKKTFRPVKSLIYGFIAAVALLLCACAIGGMYPFGKTALLREDAVYQYVGFFGWFSRVLHGNANLFYSASKGLGGSTIGLFAYYLASPFNLVMAFFHPSDAPKVMSVLIILKLGLMSGSMAWFAVKRFNSSIFLSLILGLSYGLAGCNFVAGSNLMWLDGSILLPFICYSIYRFINLNKATVLFPILISISIILNWYIGYQLCLFSLLWFIFEISNFEFDRKLIFHLFLCLCFNLFIGVMISAIIFLPTVVDLFGTGSAPSTSSNGSFISSLNLYALISKWDMSNTSIHPDSSGLAGGLYLNSFLLACLVYMISIKFGKKVQKSKNILLGIAFLLLLSELFQPLSLIWTGFSRADSYNPRFHYLLIFTVCVIANYCCNSLSSKIIEFKYVSLIAPIILIIGSLWILGYMSFKKLILFQLIALIAVFLCIRFVFDNANLHGLRYGKFKVAAGIVISCFSLIEFIYPIVNTFTADSSSPKLNVEVYSNYFNSISKLSAQDSSSSANTRSEHCGVTYLGKANRTFPTGESMALGMNGVNHYSSAGTQQQKNLLGALGYCGIKGTRGITYYNASVPVSDILIGIGSVITSSESQYVYGSRIVDNEDSPFGTLSLNVLDGKRSLAYVMSGEGNRFKIKDNPFINQEAFANSIFGTCSLYNQLHSTSDVNHANGSRLIYYKCKNDGPLYLTVKSDSVCDVYVNDLPVQSVNDWEFSSNILSIGTFHSGDNVNVCIKGVNLASINNADVKCYALNESAFNELLNLAEKSSVDIKEYSDGCIKGSVSVNRISKCFISVPFEKGWSATVNGVPVRISNFNGFMSVPIFKGLNEIVLEYKNPYLFVGFCISVFGVFLLIISSKLFNRFLFKKVAIHELH